MDSKDRKQASMDGIFSDRITDVPRSFIREILKVALDPSVISFAGGLPNREFFPVEALKAATEKVFSAHGRDILQYSNSEGYLKLREYIAYRYMRTRKLHIPVEDILITSGSQQGLDLLGKILVNDGDGVIIEEPGYLGAIQAFSIYRPNFLPVPVSEDGLDTQMLKDMLSSEKPKLIYTVPNFQNPSGISYPQKNRLEVAEIVARTNTVLIEDDAYGELRFAGKDKTSFKELLPENTVMLGSFSKVIIPGFRLGWMVAAGRIMDKLIIAKQAADLLTSHFTQSIVFQYLCDNDINRHIGVIRNAYGSQCRAMLESIQKEFPPGVNYTKPEGGMFTWAELPSGLTSLELFEEAVTKNVIFVPGDPFYVNRTGTQTLRLNFSCVNEETIADGISRLGGAIRELLQQP